MAFVRTPGQHLDRAAAERRPSARRRALGVDAEYGPLVMLEIVRSPGPSATIMSGWSTIPPRARRWWSIPSVAEPVLAGGGGARLADHPDLEHALAPRSYRRQRRDQGGDRLHDHRPGRGGAIPTLDRIVGGGDRASDSATIEAELHRHPRPYRRPYRLSSAPARAGRLRRRHPVRDGLRPAVRGHGGADARQHCSGSPRLPPDTRSIAARIYARQRPLRADRRAGQCRRWSSGWRGRGRARARRGRPCRRRSRWSAPPTPSCGRRVGCRGAGEGRAGEPRRTAFYASASSLRGTASSQRL